jgi:hypothetical protein
MTAAMPPSSKDPNALSSSTQKEEQEGRDLVQARAEALANDLVSGQKLSTKIPGQEEQANHDAPYQIAENDLQESPVAGVGKARHADDGKRAGLCSNDRERDGPPGYALVGEEVAFQGAILLAKTQAEESNRRQVDRNQYKVGRA